MHDDFLTRSRFLILVFNWNKNLSISDRIRLLRLAQNGQTGIIIGQIEHVFEIGYRLHMFWFCPSDKALGRSPDTHPGIDLVLLENSSLLTS
jgi:hypothetical protein